MLTQMKPTYAGHGFAMRRIGANGQLEDDSKQNLPNANDVASLVASTINTLSVPPVTLELLRTLRDRGCPLVDTELIVNNGGEWMTARVSVADHDFKKVRP